MESASVLVGLALAFVLTHLVPCLEPIRRRLVATLGLAPYRTLYSLVTLAIFLPMTLVYLRSPDPGPWLWRPALVPPLTTAVLFVSGLGVVLLVAGALRPSPAALLPGPTRPEGVQRITRHPVMMGFSLVAASHLPAAGSVSGLAFFGSNLVVAVVGAWHQDRRKRAEGDPATVAFLDATPFLPFAGPGRFQGLRELRPSSLVAGVALAVGILLLHDL